MYNPISTYRLQFHKKFGFKEAEKLVPYFNKLGVGTIYASPVLEAAPGSMHGYDGINPQNINPEIGTRDDLIRLNEKLKQNHIGWLQDIVPNHLAFDTENPWIDDILEKGMHSPYSGYFDIRWSDAGPLMVPFLGTDLNSAINEGTIKLIFSKGRFFFNVYEQNYPVNPSSYSEILMADSSTLHPEMQNLIDSIPELTGNEKDIESWKKYVETLFAAASVPANGEYIQSCLEKVNSSEDFITQLLNEQVYQLCHWQLTHEKINYRRFFTVNGLICLNIQNKKVFEAYHEAILKLAGEGIFQGLRIDHIDGLYDPQGYLKRLRGAAGKETYIVVEKILEHDEVIPADWPVEGATGYSFLATVNNLLTCNQSEKHFTDFYKRLSRDQKPVAQQIKSRKEFILYQRMAGELDNLYADLKHALVVLNDNLSQFNSQKLKSAIGAFLIEFPVYRFYGRQMPLPSDEATSVGIILEDIIQTQKGLKDAAILLKQLLLEKTGNGNHVFDERMLHFYRRMMQISGPLMAKGVEDTLMYSYSRFIGHNEVGDSLEVFGIDVHTWHDKMHERMNRHPLTMNTTSTHDTKRGEDVRARLNVLTEVPDLWFEYVTSFQQINKTLKSNNAPDQNDEYFIYLTLCGMYPMPGQPDEDVGERLKEYIPKALREAKVNSNWTNPEENYEDKVTDFALLLLDKNRPFWKVFTGLHTRVSDFGIINSLSQLILKCTSPGLPDIYQGAELWDLSLVDPDNRRPVDYGLRMRWLDELGQLALQEPNRIWELLWEERYNGKIKLWLTHRLLQFRKENPELFMYGEYIPLKVNGKYGQNILVFARQYKEKWLLVAVPLFMAKLCNANGSEILSFDWSNTEIVLPEHAPRKWQGVLQTTSVMNVRGVIGLNKIDLNLPMIIYETDN
ncbi:MAG: malto-oligosyltrehalose synthase [Prolixibacteraceae bacterium]|nr:malto-oligosyltrehalose synthase [Prolixibacteraceae bacterium]